MAISKIRLSSSDRFCFVGKTGSGKSFAAVILACLLLPWSWPPKVRKPWQIWWVETKGVSEDIERLHKWGFRDATRVPKNWPRVIFRIKPIDMDDELSVAKQVQALCWRASRRGNVLVVIDEYVSCVMSARSIGAGIKELTQRGRGKRVGLLGETQEPKGVPRQLASQATHLLLFNVTFSYDVEWCQDLCPQYGDGPSDLYGFWYRWLDGPKQLTMWQYYASIYDFIARISQARESTQKKEQAA